MVLVLLLVDSRHEPTEDDRLMYDWLTYYGLDPVIIATKADKISKVRQKKAVDNIFNTLRPRKRSDVILFSAATKMGKDEAWEVIEGRL